MPLTLLITDVVPNATVAVAYSTTGIGPLITPIGVVALSDPIVIAFAAAADGNGRLEIPLGTLGALLGLPLHLQALDLAAPALTNYFTIIL